MSVRAARNKRARLKYAQNREKEVARSAAWNKANAARVNKNARDRRKKKPLEFVLYWNARNRAKAQAIPFKIEMSDIVVPKFCPILGLELVVGSQYARANSPSLDRIIPELGYIKGNIAVVSHKANTIKNNATVTELERVLEYLKEQLR